MLSVFRKRIGSDGIKAIFNASIEIFGKKSNEIANKEVIIDSTVQEKYTAFPTDINLAIDVIEKIWQTCDINDIKLRNKYKKEVAKLRREAAFNKSNKKYEIKTNILGKLRDIGLRLLKEMTRKLNNTITVSEQFQNQYDNYFKVLTQKKDDKNKIYSIVEPHIYCICKGKMHKKYEFGTKVSFIINKTGMILSALNFETNIHDNKTIQPPLDDLKDNLGFVPEKVIGDYGYRGKKYFGNTIIITPIPNLDILDDINKKIHIERMNIRSSIEQTISHMKNDFRLGRNELRGAIGDEINVLMSAAAHNFSLYVRLHKRKIENKQKRINKQINKNKTK